MNPEDADTVRFDDRRWLPPAPTLDDLPAGDDLRDGDMCLVQDENAVYEFQGGVWVREVTMGQLID